MKDQDKEILFHEYWKNILYLWREMEWKRIW